METKESVQNPYQAATIPAEHLDEKLLQPSSFADLILAPRRFFLNLKQYLGARYVVPSIFVMGMAAVIDRIDMAMLRANPGSLPGAGLGRFSDSWTSFWLVVVIAGVLGGALRWLLLGWWYRVRLRWSGAVNPDRDQARAAFIFSEIIVSVPSVLLVLAQTPFYANYAEAYHGNDLAAVSILLFAVWSVITSYRAATTAFEGVKTGRAVWWFLILPLCLYAVVVAGATAAVLARG